MSSNPSIGPAPRARVVVVEDSFPVADSLKYLLESGGYEVVGMAGNVRTALELIAAAPFDIAVLDINLRGEHVIPVADAIRKLGKPVIFLSGYGDVGLLPARLRDLPRLEKPVDLEALCRAVETSCL